ncbi:GAF domain-containing protein [Paenibacillus sp. SYP-B4298]|uniref:GAF domain-containing protein n=1 Tax=Paenibacillus sp. SYP-B4298 TaxID=2996034 RepID=UPI0022DE2D93|nr:GAF domain-containing protein [Paenibacillus sp. SYP-B4298]
MFNREAYAGSREENYELLLKQLEYLMEPELPAVANLANAAALLAQCLVETNWVGFYLLDNGELVLGPFQGLPACTRIPVGRGVCGAAVEREEAVLVADVHEFPGHIACDGATNAEVVIPLRAKGEIVGVLDIDSPVKGRFDETDVRYLIRFNEVLGRYL